MRSFVVGHDIRSRTRSRSPTEPAEPAANQPRPGRLGGMNFAARTKTGPLWRRSRPDSPGPTAGVWCGQPPGQPRDLGGRPRPIAGAGPPSTSDVESRRRVPETAKPTRSVTMCSQLVPSSVGPVGLEPTTRGLKGRRIAATMAPTCDYAHTASPTSPTSRPWLTSIHATNHATPAALVPVRINPVAVPPRSHAARLKHWT
jgi:hypothetical protein